MFSLIIGLLLVFGFKSAQLGHFVLAVIVPVVVLALVQLLYVCLRKRIIIDHKSKQVTLEFVRYATCYFDIYPKRRVVIAFNEIASIQHGLMRTRGGHQLSWHVYTRASRFEFTIWMEDEEKLREMLQGISAQNSIPDSECRYLRDGMSFEFVLLIAVVCLFILASSYTILIFVI